MADDEGSSLDPGHLPVLGQQVLQWLDPRPRMVCLDCTVGRGGHGALIVPHLAPGGRYIGLDMDPANVDFARQRLSALHAGEVTVEVYHHNFALAGQLLKKLGVAQVDLVLGDLGFASNQMDDPARGLSFQRQGPLDMRLDPTLPRTAADLVATLGERELADLIYRYGEERYSRKIAAKIVEIRRRKPIKNTLDLAEICRQVYGGRGRIDPATRTFMALRIAVNGELEALEGLLGGLLGMLGPGGIAAIISFHSLEDRLVKQAFSQWHRQGAAERMTRKVVRADAQECRQNRRSRSARLRVIRRLHGTAS